MPRSIRIQYAGGFYHVMARGNRRENIFLDEDDRRGFLRALGEVCAMTGWRVHAWVLLSNHYHFLLQTPEPNLVAGMSWLQNTYTRRFNTRHRLWGRLFGDRYKAVLVEGSGYYYETVLDYIHLNPVRARLIKPLDKQSVLDFPWSSVSGGYALPPSRRPEWLAVPEGLKAFGYPDTTNGRRRWVERLDRRASEEEAQRCGVPAVQAEADARQSHLRRGWYWGSQSFVERTLQLAGDVLGQRRHRNYRASRESRAHGEDQARKLLTEGLSQARLAPSDLPALKGSDSRKVEIARAIREQTTMSLGWVAEHLSMKSATNVSQQLRRHGAKAHRRR